MRITLKSTGGFAGAAAPETISLDVDEQPEPVRARFQQAVKEIQPASALTNQPRTSADFQHLLTIEDGGTLRTLSFHDGQASPVLARLMDLLRQSKG
ncbi:MAG TPA: protealysin inhibitor emfourin [Gemmatimonadales bacterium]|jgi:hypothetical protein